MSTPPRHSDTGTRPIRPSGIPDIQLPFGPPASALSEQQSNGPISADLRRRIRALSNNANRVREKSPIVAAQSWYEAGRLLDRHANRYADAWICYSRAVALFPDLKIALSALLRLSRLTLERDTTCRLIDAVAARAHNPNEQAALLSEQAVLFITQGAFSRSCERLLEARRVSPDAIVPKLLLTLVSSAFDPKEQRAELIGNLAEDLASAPVAEGLQKAASQLRMTERKESLPPGESHKIDIQAAWIHLRFCLKRRQNRAALRLVSRMIVAAEDPVLKKSLARLKTTLAMLEGTLSPQTDRLAPDPMHSLLSAISNQNINREQAISALKEAQLVGKTALLRRSFALIETLIGIKKDGHNILPQDDKLLPKPVIKGAQSFVKMASTNDPLNTKVSAAALHRALSQKSWPQVATQLQAFWKKTSDESIRWPLMVARTAVQIEHLGSGPEAQKLILEETDTPFWAPLPTIMRRMTRHRQGLADIAIRESEAASDDVFKANRLAWAAHHLEQTDPFEAARLYSQAVKHDPSQLFAIAGLRRTGTFDEELASLYEKAAQSCAPSPHRGLANCHAGVARYRLGQVDDAGRLFCEAAIDLLEEQALTYTGLSISLNRQNPPQCALTLLGMSDLSTQASIIGSLTLFFSPLHAMQSFQATMKADPADPIIERGFEEAHFQAKRPAPVSERLLTTLRRTEEEETSAATYQRLAQIDRFISQDPSAAILFAHSLSERLPGHRPTLGQMMVHYLLKRRRSDLRRVLTALSMSITDEKDAASLAALTALHDPSHIDLLRHSIKNKPATALELISLEGRCSDIQEQIDLVSTLMQRFPSIGVYHSRLADLLGRKGRHTDAIAQYKRSIEQRFLVLYNLIALTAELRAAGEHQLLVDTLSILSDYYAGSGFKSDLLVAAAKLARDNLNTLDRAVGFCMLALRHEPNHQKAFEVAEQILIEHIDAPETYIELIETRLTGKAPPLERLVLHLKMKDLLGRFEDEASAEKRKHHEEAAISIIINDNPGFDDTLTPQEQAAKEEEWLEGVDRVIAHDRLPHDAKDDVALFAAIGDNMITFMDDDIRAEHYFDKALNLDVSNATSLSFMAELRMKSDDAVEAAELYEQLFEVTKNPTKKRQTALRLAEIYIDYLANETLAEPFLQAAANLDPTDLSPVRTLIEMAVRQADDFTLNVHLDTALAQQCQAIRQTPKQVIFYKNVAEIIAHLHLPHFDQLAADLLAMIENESSAPQAVWRYTPALSDPASEPYLCPENITHALRATIDVMDAPIRIIVDIDSKISAAKKQRKKSPLWAIASELAGDFGIKEVICKVSSDTHIQVIKGTPTTLLFPQRFLDAPEPVKRYAVAYAFELCALNLGPTTLVSKEHLIALLAGLMRVYDKAYSHPTVSKDDVLTHAKEIARFTARDQLTHLAPHVPTVRKALLEPDFAWQISAPGHRAGFLSVSNLQDALAGYRWVEACDDIPLLEMPGIGLLLSFVFSRDHRLLRERLEP